MIFSTILYLLIVILLLSTAPMQESATLPPLQTFILFTLKILLFDRALRLYLAWKKPTRATAYFKTEKYCSIVVIILLVSDLYLLSLSHYLKLLPGSKILPSLPVIAGVGIYFLYQAVLRARLRKSYQHIFGGNSTAVRFIVDTLKITFSFILPWLFLSLTMDLIPLIPAPKLKQFLEHSLWAEPALILLITLITITFLPTIMVRLWGCKPLPDNDARRLIESCSRRQDVSFQEICTWPMFERRVLTAGVIGFIKPSRYLLMTPALLESVTPEELEGVVSHEIGHVKKGHLLLYLLIFIGFIMISQLLSQPVVGLFIRSAFFLELAGRYNGDPASLLVFMTGLPFMLGAILFFRYVFGYFMRNFERQADLYSYEVLGSAGPLIRVLEKIAWLSGNIRNEPSWHHFGIGQRVDFLRECERNRSTGRHHNFKVYGSLTLYLTVVLFGSFASVQITPRLFSADQGRQYAETLIAGRIQTDPHNPLWHQLQGDLYAGRHKYPEAMTAYAICLKLDPKNPEVLNNLAWLLLTARDPQYRNYSRALTLAQNAVEIQNKGYILDTLAEAYWLNNFPEKAVEIEREAMTADPGNREYYKQQEKKFLQSNENS
ncbi:MAG: M48 family metalloprotease [Proteobacteria bacterium]|nr:M48 family metalloprotease [Pseudomonadota bacterium]MBU1685778.1 M48 family metalloprotease [Pseudomonadota bacterium]